VSKERKLGRKEKGDWEMVWKHHRRRSGSRESDRWITRNYGVSVTSMGHCFRKKKEKFRMFFTVFFFLFQNTISNMVRTFKSEQGITILVGENAGENDSIRRRASQKSLWLHLDGMPSAHVLLIIERTPPTRYSSSHSFVSLIQ
jgi:hypothetical protein